MNPCACGCEKLVKKRYAQGHNSKGGRPPVIFDESYEIQDRGYDTPCWIWTKTTQAPGYGKISHAYAHRHSYERFVGTIPVGCDVDHLCRVPPCVNPDHLEAVPHLENVRRGMAVKIPQETIDAIREAVGFHKDIAKRFGVSQSHVTRIRLGKTRRHHE